MSAIDCVLLHMKILLCTMLLTENMMTSTTGCKEPSISKDKT